MPTALFTKNTQVTSYSGQYRKVLDGRKQPIGGLWQRNECFYARLKVEEATGKSAVRWIPLVDENQQALERAAQAKAALVKLKVQREDSKFPFFGETQKNWNFSIFSKT